MRAITMGTLIHCDTVAVQRLATALGVEFAEALPFGVLCKQTLAAMARLERMLPGTLPTPARVRDSLDARGLDNADRYEEVYP